MRRQGPSLGQLISLMQHLGHPEQDAAQAAATEQVPQRPDEDPEAVDVSGAATPWGPEAAEVARVATS